MPTRPSQGGSNDTWGTELNAWLDASRTAISTFGPTTITIPATSFGAKFDNATDDTAAIQAALNAASFAVYGFTGNDKLACTVQMPAGRAIVNGTLTIPPNVTLRGQGIAATYLYRTTAGGGSVLLVANGSVEQTLSDFGIIHNPNDSTCIDLTGSNGSASILGDGHVVLRDVVCVGGTNGVYVGNGTEHRLSRVACYRQSSIGIFVDNATDCFIEGSTVAASAATGMYIKGANHRVYGCKVFGAASTTGGAYYIEGAGRTQVAACEAQDCAGYAFIFTSSENTFSACHADSCQHGFCWTNGAQGSVLSGCIAGTRGGGLYTMDCAIGFRYGGSPDDVTVHGLRTYGGVSRVSNGTLGSDNSIDAMPAIGAFKDIDNRCGAQSIAYATPITPDPWAGGHIYVGTLTGALTINNPAAAWYQTGQEMTFSLTQDGSGGHTVTFGGGYKTTGAISTTLSTTTTITFLFDGTNWREISRAVT